MMKKIEHIGIAVKDIENSNHLFAALFGKKHYKIEDVESEGVNSYKPLMKKVLLPNLLKRKERVFIT